MDARALLAPWVFQRSDLRHHLVADALIHFARIASDVRFGKVNRFSDHHGDSRSLREFCTAGKRVERSENADGNHGRERLRDDQSEPRFRRQKCSVAAASAFRKYNGAAAVFQYQRGRWGTGGRVLMNMNPAEAVIRLAGQFAPVISGDS